jgi:hypothetical protein
MAYLCVYKPGKPGGPGRVSLIRHWLQEQGSGQGALAMEMRDRNAGCRTGGVARASSRWENPDVRSVTRKRRGKASLFLRAAESFHSNCILD